VIHKFSDKDDLPKATLRVYSLEEILVEKLRAFSGQRRHAIARDIFDIYFLTTHGVDETQALGAVDAKFRFKGINIEAVAIEAVRARIDDFRVNWQTNLEYLLPNSLRVPFEQAWDVSLALLQRSMMGVDRRSK
jgi:predicted nucleotidyltransferase component of viral defense system